MLISRSIEVCPSPVLFSNPLIYEAAAPAAQIDADLNAIAEQDKVAEQDTIRYGKRLERLKTGLLVSPIVGIVCLSISFHTYSALGLLLLFLITSSLYVQLRLNRSKRLDVPNVRYKLAQQMIRMLSRDMDETIPLTIRLRFAPITNRKHSISSRQYTRSAQRKGPSQRYSPGRKIEEEMFSLEWLSLSGQFIDKTNFSLQLTEKAVVRSWYKKGNHRQKIKCKGVDAQLMLSFSRKRYGAISVLKDEVLAAIALPPCTTLKRLKINDHQLLLSVKVSAASPLLRHANSPKGLYQLFTQLLLGAYHVLNLSKALSVPSRVEAISKAA